MNPTFATLACVATVAAYVLILPGCADRAAPQAALERAQAQVQRIAEELDEKTTKSGVYVRVKEGEIKERDPWGTKIQISYAQGGIAEIVRVRSAGPDREFQTKDDVQAARGSINLKGIGEGVKENAEETAAKAAKGFVKGTLEGAKESIESRPAKKGKDGDAQAP